MNIRTVFISKPNWEAGWPYLGFQNEPVRDMVLERLAKRFPDVQFTGGDIITKYEATEVEKVKREIEQADGLFLYAIGHYGDPGIVQAGEEFLQVGKPSILANSIYGGDHTFIKTYERVKGKALRVLPVSSPDFEDVEWALQIMQALLRLKGKKVLIYAPDEIAIHLQGVMELAAPDLACMAQEQVEYLTTVMGQMSSDEGGSYLDLEGADQAHQWRRDEEKYRKHMQEVFGLELVKRDPQEISAHYEKVGEQEAGEVAERWIREAKGVESTRQAILNAARLYLAIKRLIEEMDAISITPDCGTLLIAGYLPAFPCLAFSQLLNDSFTATCESDLDSNLSALLGCSLFGRPGFVSNHCLDLAHKRVIYLHCMAATKLYGPGGPPAELDIVHHGESHFIGAVPRVRFPAGEGLTTIKISMLEKKLALRHGRILGQVADEKGCVTKVLVESDAERILENYDWMTFGWHRVSFVGDWRKEFIAAARLAGLEVVEEDK
ncbi:MAG: hypothetical protein ACP5Q1_06325 [Anaerolineae bacterium]